LTASVRQTSPFERVVTLELSNTDIDGAKTAAARRLSKDLRIPGFRPGKAPRPVVEATIGAERLRTEAIEDLIPTRLGTILDDASLTPAVSPSLEKIDEVEDGVSVEVKVTLWPSVESLPSYQDRVVEIDPPTLTEEELESNLVRMREQFATLETVERPANEGDFVSVDLNAARAGVPVEEASASELLYEIGSGLLTEGADDQLVGRSAGEIVAYDAPLPTGFGDQAGTEVTFTIKVNEVKAKVLPDLDDEWVDEVTEYETVDQLRQALSERILESKRRAAARQFREGAIGALVDETAIEIPERLIQAEMEETLHRFVHRLEGQDISLQDYLSVTGLGEKEFLDDLRNQSERNLRTQVVLETVARQEELKVEPEEVAATIEALAQSSDRPDDIRRAFQDQVRVLSLASDILRNKAIEVVVAAARAVDDGGNQVDLALDESIIEIDDQSGVVEAQLVEGDEVEAELVEAEIVDEEA
jgi:trigger factor